MARKVPKPKSDPSLGDDARAGERSRPSRPRRLRRLAARLGFIVLVLLLVLSVALVIVTRSGVAKRLVVPLLEARTGSRITADDTSIDLTGQITMRGLKGVAPGVSGEAATFLEVETLNVSFSWGELFRGGDMIQSVTLIRPKLRLSQSSQTQTLNVSGLNILRPTGSGSGGIPSIVIDDASVEIGEHDDGWYTPLHIVYFDASIIPDAGSSGSASTIRIAPLAPEGPIVGLPGHVITGRIDETGITVTPAEVSLAAVRPSTMPKAVREELELLDLAGQLRVRSFRYVFASGKVEAEFRLAGVALNLPIAPQDPSADAGPLRMTRVNGVIALRPDRMRAELRGFFADMPYTVRMTYEGSTVDAPFTCQLETDGFQVSERPDLLPFAPPVVIERLMNFSSPTAVVNARATITRGPPTPEGPAPIKVVGTLDFRDGTAAFDQFPYRFEQLSGTVSFDDSRIDLLRIEGVAPSGATIRATGVIAPPDETAYVDVRVHVENLPVDETLAKSMGPEREEIISALFSRRRHQELIDAGLVMTLAEEASLKADEAALRAMRPPTPESESRLRAIERRRRALPAFAPGGLATVDVRVERMLGVDADWLTTVLVRFDELGVLAENFPLPIVGQDVTLKITDDFAELESGTYQSLRGGQADVVCTATLTAPDGSKGFLPTITINATSIPIDPLLINAIPDDASADAISAREILARLSLTGRVDATAMIAPDDQGSLGYDATITFQEIEARPAHAFALPAPPGTPPTTSASSSSMVPAPDVPSQARLNGPAGPSLALTDVAGRVHVGTNHARVDLRAALHTLKGPLDTPSEATRSGIATLALDAEVSTTIQRDDEPGEIDAPAPVASVVPESARPFSASVRIESLNVQAPIEDIVRVITPDNADALTTLCRRHAPSGVLDLDATIERAAGPLRSMVEISGIGSLAFRAFDRNITLSVPEGRIILTPGDPGRTPTVLTFDEFAAAIDDGGVAAGRLAVSGEFGIDPASPGSLSAAHTFAEIDWTGASFDGAIVADVIRARASAELSAIYAELSPAGLFDLKLSLSPSRTTPEKLTASGAFRPRTLSFTRYGERVEFPSVAGAILFDADGGVIDRFALNAENLSLRIDGSWTTPGNVPPAIELAFNGWAQNPGQSLHALLPEAIHRVVERTELQIPGELRIDDLRLAITNPGATPTDDPAAAARAIRASGSFSVDRASLSVGVPITDLSGTVQFMAGVEGEQNSFNVGVMAPTLTLAGIRITDARIRASSDPERPNVVMPLITGSAHGGRVSARAIIAPNARDPSLQSYYASLHIAGARFASILGDLSRARGLPLPPTTSTPSDDQTAADRPTETETAWVQPDDSRGLLDAELSISGLVGDPASQTGRGEFAVSGGEVISLPLLLPIIQVANLQVPTREDLDLALASFHLSEGRISFEELSVFSPSVELFGYGTMDWPGTDLDLRIVSRATRPMPLISGIFETIRDELVTIRVGGKMTDAKVTVSQFSGTRGLARRLFGGEQSQQTRELEQIRIRANEARDRVRRSGERIKELGTSPAREGW